MVITTRTVLTLVVPTAAVAIVTLIFWTRRKSRDKRRHNSSDDVTTSKDDLGQCYQATDEVEQNVDVKQHNDRSRSHDKLLVSSDKVVIAAKSDVTKSDVAAKPNKPQRDVRATPSRDNNRDVISKAAVTEQDNTTTNTSDAIFDEDLIDSLTSIPLNTEPTRRNVLKPEQLIQSEAVSDLLSVLNSDVINKNDVISINVNECVMAPEWSPSLSSAKNINASNMKKTAPSCVENGSDVIVNGVEDLIGAETVHNDQAEPMKWGEEIVEEENDKQPVDQDVHRNSHSDTTSEVSSDSGNGNSVLESQSSPTVNVHCYQFEFPTRLCGKFVGKNGRNVNQLKNASGAQITLLEHPYYVAEYQICTLEGTEDEVSIALDLIQEKFPTDKFSDVSYEQFLVQGPDLAHPVLSSDVMELRLISGILNDVVISSIVDASQVFVQQPAHPSFPTLENLNMAMNICYNQDYNVPCLPTPVEVGVVCAAPLMGGWYRAQVVAWNDELMSADVKYLDYGGFGRVAPTELKQIRGDFMTIPFQGCECYLANVAPLDGEQIMSLAASAVLEEMTQGSMLQCEIVQYDEMTKVPYVNFYKLSGNQTTFINRELVDRGVARWLE